MKQNNTTIMPFEKLLSLTDAARHSAILKERERLFSNYQEIESFYLKALDTPDNTHTLDLLEEIILQKYWQEVSQECVQKSISLGRKNIRPYYLNHKGEVADIFSTIFSTVANGHERITQRFCSGEMGSVVTFKDRYDTLFHTAKIIHFINDEMTDIQKSLNHVLFNFGENKPAQRFNFYKDCIVFSLDKARHPKLFYYIFNQLVKEEPGWQWQKEPKLFLKELVYTALKQENDRLDVLEALETEDLMVGRVIERLNKEFKKQGMEMSYSPRIKEWVEARRTKALLEKTIVNTSADSVDASRDNNKNGPIKI